MPLSILVETLCVDEFRRGCSLPNRTAAAKKVQRSDDGRYCIREVVESTVKPKLESCVQQTFPSFSFPETGQNGTLADLNFDKESDQALSLLCPNPFAAQEARICLQLRRREIDEQLGRGSRNGESRGNIIQCGAIVTAECKQEFKSARQALCNCSLTLQFDDEVRSALTACPQPKIGRRDSYLRRFCGTATTNQVDKGGSNRGGTLGSQSNALEFISSNLTEFVKAAPSAR